MNEDSRSDGDAYNNRYAIWILKMNSKQSIKRAHIKRSFFGKIEK